MEEFNRSRFENMTDGKGHHEIELYLSDFTDAAQLLTAIRVIVGSP